MAKIAIEKILKTVPSFFGLKLPQAWFDYDEEADVLYISFERPQNADETEMTADDILVRRRDGQVVGLTILHASRFKNMRPSRTSPR